MDYQRINELRQSLAEGVDILGRRDYQSSAVLVPLFIRADEEYLLFEKRAPFIQQGNEICFPGGHCDTKHDKSSLETALRESREELGIESEQIEILGQLDTLVSPRGIIVESFLGLIHIADVGQLELDKDEVAEVFTVPIAWFVDNPPEIYHTRVEIQSSYVDEKGREKILLPVDELGLPSRYKNNRSEWLHRVIVYKYDPHIIWGLTASIVYELVEKHFQSEKG